MTVAARISVLGMVSDSIALQLFSCAAAVVALPNHENATTIIAAYVHVLVSSFKLLPSFRRPTG